MQISDFKATVLSVPVVYPAIDKPQPVAVVYVEITTDGGLVGTAATTYPMAHTMQAFLQHEAGPVLIGLDPRRTELVRSRLMLELSQRNIQGTWSRGASLVDMACWDIKGKALNEPIWRLIGGARDYVDTYVTFGIPKYSREQLADVAKSLVAQGHTGLKIVVGASSAPDGDHYGLPTDSDVAEDIQRVTAVREAVGDGIALMIDANKNFTLPQALRLAQAVEPLGLAWFEDPVLNADPRLMAELRAQIGIPIAAGGLGVGDPMYLREYVDRQAVDILQPNVRDIGGFTGAMASAALAYSYNMPIAMGGSEPHANVHFHAGVPNGGLVEYHWQGWKFADALYDGVPEPQTSRARLTEAPGLGLEVRRDALEEFEQRAQSLTSA